MRDQTWPRLPLAEWNDTLATLHLMFEIVGKVRLAQAPMQNHWWQVTLYVTARGLTTSVMPHGTRAFEIEFDFIDHVLDIRACEGPSVAVALEPMPIARFYRDVMNGLDSLGLPVKIRTTPLEVADPIPFGRDETHRSYDREYVERFWRALLQADRLCKIFRSRFIGKVSPVHFFWGGPDLAVSRFSGRRAPTHPGGIPTLPDWVTREAYSHEVSSAGWWPGGYGVDASFYSYAYPEPQGFAQASAGPKAAFWHTQLREFILPYEAVRASDDPDAMVLEFFQSTYEAAATLAKWNRAELER